MCHNFPLTSLLIPYFLSLHYLYAFHLTNCSSLHLSSSPPHYYPPSVSHFSSPTFSHHISIGILQCNFCFVLSSPLPSSLFILILLNTIIINSLNTIRFIQPRAIIALTATAPPHVQVRTLSLRCTIL